MKLEVLRDEKFPVFSMCFPEKGNIWGVLVEIPDDVVDNFFMIQSNYEHMQKTLKELYDKTSNKAT